jgi:hypothetical protein
MKLIKIGLMAVVFIASLPSCKKFLDVNTNPNSPTSVQASLVLPQAIVYTASTLGVSFHDYGSWQAGYFANAGGFGGWGNTITYEFTTGSFNGLWSSTYDNLEDYEYIISETNGRDTFAYFNAVARIMKVFNYQLLADEYDQIPYTDALKGLDKLTPKYDAAQDVYKKLYTELDEAIAIIDNAKFPNALGTADVVFGGSTVKWKQFANTIKLKLRIRASKTNTFTGNPTFSADGFLTEDAIVNPGFAKVAGQQNPFWNTYHSSATGAQAGSGRSRIPTYWILTFYDGSKIDDEGRGNVIFRGFKSGLYPPRNQLGVTSSGIQSAPSDNTSWYTETVNYANSTNSVGVLKGPAMGQPLLLATESYLLQAEAVEKGLIAGNAKSLFNKGIESSFLYLYKGVDNKVATGYNPVTDAANYLTINSGTRLVNYDLATTPEQKLEAIITQKYIALNMIDGREAWAEFRRTGYPTINNTLPLNQSNTFVSTVSASTAPDRLPGRILYPNNEFQVNPDNVPKGINTFTSYVFWDRRK